MHIPDGYLSPATCGVMGAAAAPAWFTASRRVRRVVTSRHVPHLALAAAFSFLVMMLNVPVPGGTTAHAIGATLIAVVLGPWAAVIAVSVALVIQALCFGDGGVLALGANCLVMAVVMPFVGWVTYRIAARGSDRDGSWHAAAAALGAYVGLNAGALVAAVALGLQPTLFHDASGAPLYAPFHLGQTIPAMALAHLTVAGFAEAAVTFGVVRHLQRANRDLWRLMHPDPEITPDLATGPRPLRWGWVAALVVGLVAITPLGLLAPGSAFGEDPPSELDLGRYHLAAVPHGLQRFAGFWHHALFDGYGFDGERHPVLAYLASASVGVVVIGALVAVIAVGARAVRRRRGRPAQVPA